ncbi:NRT1/ PTR FAMILY 3.1 [Spatholobus suberectus]|nr:NRT1/ PTR FAMILY 3.1 [Spatholobus suberectus]
MARWSRKKNRLTMKIHNSRMEIEQSTITVIAPNSKSSCTNELCDRFASAGFNANMISYLTQQLNMPLVSASITLTNFSGTSNFTPLLGAFIADSFAGRFWTIVVASLIYELGLVIITVSAILPHLHPPPCPTQVNCQEASSSQLWILYISLLLISLGTGGIRPCVVPFSADQFDMTKNGVASRKWNLFNWYFFCMGLASLSALTIVVYIQDNMGWGWGLGIPTIAMLLSVIAFVLGSPLYKTVKPHGSPLVRLVQVVVAAVKKRKEALPEDAKLLYQNWELDSAISLEGRLLHSDQFKCLDKAAIVTDEEGNDPNAPPNLWKLATVHRVEELKSIIRMLPIWASGILLITASSNQHSFVILQARTMNRHLSHSFQIPPASMSIFNVLTMMVGIVLYERLFVPFARRFNGNPSGITCLQRMGVGFVVNILATLVSALVEIKRKAVAAKYHLLDSPNATIPIRVFWLVPQYCLHGVAEVFMVVGHLEFLYDQSPESMRSTATALYCITTAVGNYVGTLLVSLVHKYSGKERNWLPDRNLNRGRLECYYFLVSGIQLVNLIYYLIYMEIEKSVGGEVALKEEADSKKRKRQQRRGGIRTLPFILANEFCDRFAVAGFNGNLISYLTQVLNMPLVSASNILTIFGGTASFTPLLGALIAESFAGRFWTITGLVSLTVSAILHHFRPPPCPTQVNCQEATPSQLSLFYISLLLTSLGSGGIRPCVVPFLGDQFDMTKNGVASRKWNLFNWYFFSLGLASLSALTIVVYIQDNTGWGWGFGIPTIVMLVSIIAFVLGSPLYKTVKPEGSPLVRLAQVIVAAIRKRKETLPDDPKFLYQNMDLDAAFSLEGRLLHTDQYKWLDKAAIVTGEEGRDPNARPNLWKLATVQRVEELKSIIRILPISSSGILLIAASSHLPSFVIQQARTMDRHLSRSFQISPASMSIFSVLTMMTGVILYERLFVPFVRRFTKNPSGITCIQRMGIGFVINTIATVVSAPVEVKRKAVAAKYHLLDDPNATIPLSVFWLVPQYCLHGLADVFMSVGLFEFLYDQSPESMRSSATALYCVVIAIGSYVGTLVVSLVHKHSGKERNWLPDRNLNRGRLDYYYLLVSGIQVLNLFYFGICVWCYTDKPLEENTKMGKQKDLEQANTKISSKEEKKQHRRGGIRTLPFILANEVCDRFASAGFHGNLISYLTQELNMPLVSASNTLTNFGGTSSLTPLIGAIVADSFAGRFWTITVASLIYELGLISITVSAILPHMRPPPCPTQVNCQEATSSQLWILYISLLLTSIGSGGIRPCVVPFSADQFDMSKSGVASRKWNLFNWYFFCMGLASLSALTIVVYIQDNMGWGWGLGIPSIAMLISIIAFVLGSPLYKTVKPEGSPLVRLAQVIVAAIKKRKEALLEDPKLLYQNWELDAPISLEGRLLHSDQYKWLDKAAIVTEEEARDPCTTPNLWKLATVHRVEELKSIIRMLPIWASGILLITSSSHLHSFVIQQARTMDRHLSHSFQISPASMSIFSVLTMISGVVIYERLFVPFARRFTGNPSGITCLQRMGVGFVINIIATVVAALLEMKRKSVAAKYHLLDDPKATIPISVFWLVPQYCLHGMAETFMSVGHLEFLFEQSPESMRSSATALYCITSAIGNYIGTLLVSLVHKYTGKERNWLPDRNLNRGRLDYYYFLVSGIQVINLIYYLICAWFYTYKPVEEIIERNKEEDLEQANEHISSVNLRDGREEEKKGFTKNK